MEQGITQSPLWDVHQAAAFIGASPATIYAWAEAGRLPHLKVGRRFLRFDPEELARWLDEQRRGGDVA